MAGIMSDSGDPKTFAEVTVLVERLVMQRRIIMCCDICCEPAMARAVGASAHVRVCWREVVSEHPLPKGVQLEPSPNKVRAKY